MTDSPRQPAWHTASVHIQISFSLAIMLSKTWGYVRQEQTPRQTTQRHCKTNVGDGISKFELRVTSRNEFLTLGTKLAPKPSLKGPGFNYVEVRMATDSAIPCVNGQRQKSVFLPSENGLKISFEPASRNKNSEEREDTSDEDELSFDVLVLGNLGN